MHFELLGIALILSICWPTSVFSQVPLGDLIPFGLSAGDKLVPAGDDNSSPKITLDFPFPFIYINETALFVNTNGALSFGSIVGSFTPTCGPIETGQRMIAPFWADVHTNQGLGGQIFYRQSKDRALLERISSEVSSANPELGGLNMRWLFVATWVNVSFFGANECHNQSTPVPQNTFQAVLSSDGFVSFVLFYYSRIEWTTGTASGGNACTGLGGKPAKVGFDAGDKVNFFAIPNACLDSIVNVTSTSNARASGKWVFRTEGIVNTQVCSTDNSTSPGTLKFDPPFSDIFGHFPLKIQGPCFNKTDKLTCTFRYPDDKHKNAIQKNATFAMELGVPTAICSVPFHNQIGRIKVELEIQSMSYSLDSTIQFSTKRSYVGELLVAWGSPALITDIPPTAPIIVDLTWDPKAFGPQITTKVRSELYYYDPASLDWQSAYVGQVNSNVGKLNIDISGIQTSVPASKLATSVLLFAIHPADLPTDIFSSRSLFSRFQCGSRIFSTPSEREGRCSLWHANATSPSRPISLACPPFFAQAILDVRFELSTYPLVADGILHPLANATFRTRLANVFGSGIECTYNKQGQLIQGPINGGNAAQTSPQTSLLRHWQVDVLPWCDCCLNAVNTNSSSLSHCGLYYERRPSIPFSGYLPPGTGLGTGDPHIHTLDSLRYTFNGAGEFWLVRQRVTGAPGILVQARMERFEGQPEGDGINTSLPNSREASVFTAIALQERNLDIASPIVQVQSSLADALQVLVDSIPLRFIDNSLLTQMWPTFSVSKSAVGSKGDQVTVAFASGWSFVVRSEGNALTITSLASQEHRGTTQGLLGQFNGNSSDDLTMSNGTIIAPDSPLSVIHQFGLSWMVNANDSLFVYAPGRNFSSHFNPDFQPNLMEPDPSSLPTNVSMVCGSSRSCLYDYVSTGGDLQFASRTAQAELAHNKSIALLETKPLSCPTLPHLSNGFIVANDGFFNGSRVQFGCMPGYYLSGQDISICINGMWSGNMPTCLQSQSSEPITSVTSPAPDISTFSSSRASSSSPDVGSSSTRHTTGTFSSTINDSSTLAQSETGQNPDWILFVILGAIILVIVIVIIIISILVIFYCKKKNSDRNRVATVQQSLDKTTRV